MNKYVDPFEEQGVEDTPGSVMEDMNRESALEAPDEETPPEPPFIIVPNAFGPGVDSVKLSDGTPVGKWLEAEHPSLDGGEIAEMLVLMGMQGEKAAWFGMQRDRAFAATTEIMAQSGMGRLAASEAHHTEKMEHYRAEFLKSMRKKEA